MRSIQVEKVRDAVRDMCIEANYSLSPDMRCVFEKACQEEKSPLGRQILNQLSENLEIAKKDEIPICQDTGMACVFLEIGQDVHLTGGLLEDAVNEGVRRGYGEGYLRKSIVEDPLRRVNTRDNTPAYLHTEIVAGDKVKITLRFRGREMAHVQSSKQILDVFSERMADVAVVDKAPKMEGRSMTMFLTEKR